MTEILGIRFGRKATVTILDGNEIVKVIKGFDQSGSSPVGLRIAFNVERKITALADTARIRIWNLNSKSRGMLAQRSLARVQRDPLRFVRLEAGYGRNFGMIFSGAIVRAVNKREGADWITEIEGNAAFGHALLNTLEKSFSRSVPIENIVREIFAVAGWRSVYFSSEANTVLQGALANTKVVSGSAYLSASKLLQDYDLTFTADIDGITVYKPGYPRDATFLPLDENSGLLGTPKVNDYGTDFRTLLDPRIRPGQKVRIDSETLRESITDPSLGRDFTLYQVTCVGDTHTDDWFCECSNARFFPPEELSALPIPPVTLSGS